ncbi:MAG: CpsD/CapB family tyrosine-protein kinase [Candidatus Omnitrophica bacterium]|nr:CpsD/CapB family tyrosine-protein kinase [Candidatus Omnitrophota bacterium]
MKNFLDTLKEVREKQLDGLGLPALPKEFILKSVSDSNINSHIVTYFDPKSPITEQYRRLREHIKTMVKKDRLKTIAVTSSIANEGKSLTSLNLAVALTKDVDCKRVLIVDCDLRRGTIASSLGMDSKVGLSDYLHLNADVENIIYKTKIKKLSIIPKGKITDDPADLLASLKMKALLENVKEKFDIIILDTAPAISVSDAGIVCSQADGTIMVVRTGKTQRGIVKHATEILTQSKVNLLGYVLTCIEYPIPEYIYKYV